ncbi:L-lactate dehydrogenase [Xylanimonas ulmi]|uniref:L-lactate dehydrogenase n=1 Tax=Xylanimonas ulmi TaxID=228973 RepID=A0A4V2EXY5_9MICO|nr:L-lactate dehydrogenase [Xylanibacterium ulmi]RZS61110.1 malate dehydrogenase (NAD) [Xylanibacterium ulmi]
MIAAPSRTKKVMIVGDGAVGSAYAHSLITLDIADEIGIIDLDRAKAHADALDLRHAVPYAPVAAKKIYAADYADCADADIVAITANAPAAVLDGDFDRLRLLGKNVSVMTSITRSVMESGFDGIFLVVSNPVDVLTRVVAAASGLPPSRVIGTGTLVETSRMRTILADYLDLHPANVHGYVLGEHGESAFTAWSNVSIGSLPIREWMRHNAGAYGIAPFDELDRRVREIGFDIFRGKGNTSYGVAGGLARVTTAILRDENVILPVSAHVEDAYQIRDLYIGVPVVVGRAGVRELVHLYLDDDELAQYARSAEILRASYDSVRDAVDR